MPLIIIIHKKGSMTSTNAPYIAIAAELKLNDRLRVSKRKLRLRELYRTVHVVTPLQLFIAYAHKSN